MQVRNSFSKNKINFKFRNEKKVAVCFVSNKSVRFLIQDAIYQTLHAEHSIFLVFMRVKRTRIFKIIGQKVIVYCTL